MVYSQIMSGAYSIVTPVLDGEIFAVEVNANKICHWFSSMESVKRAIQCLEITTSTKFVLRYRKDNGVGLKPKINWDSESTPYTKVRTTLLECQHGKDRNKLYNEKRKTKKNPNYVEMINPRTGRKRYEHKNGSIKKDCPATLRIQEVTKYPDHKASDVSLQAKRKSSTSLIEAIKNDPENIRLKTMWYVTFPLHTAHTGHVVGEATNFLQGLSERAFLSPEEVLALPKTCTQRILSILEEIRDIPFSAASQATLLEAERELISTRDKLMEAVAPDETLPVQTPVLSLDESKCKIILLS